MLLLLLLLVVVVVVLVTCWWCRFGEFEKFIYDFLVGTEPSAGGGEGLRLKMQTPLYVADALMEAARLRLQGELSAAEGELSALEAVKRQLQRFQVGGAVFAAISWSMRLLWCSCVACNMGMMFEHGAARGRAFWRCLYHCFVYNHTVQYMLRG
jgi:hypothetical protein